MFSVVFTAEHKNGYIERSVSLPFVPYVGMMISGLAEACDGHPATVEFVCFDFKSQTFYCHTDGFPVDEDLGPDWHVSNDGHHWR